MPVQKLQISEFLLLMEEHPVFDVRSPGEYAHAHIPGAYSLPLFSDEERKTVGTAYKQQGKQKAIKHGLDFFGVKMKQMVEAVEEILALRQKALRKKGNAGAKPDQHKSPVLVHCWRGGMRSAGVAWLLDLYGFEVYTLEGGYKAFRNMVLSQFEKDYAIKILGGYTGSGKTELLEALQQKGEPVINLEQLAHHKGSAFGGIGQLPQPSQEMFENKLAMELLAKTGNDDAGMQNCFWLEDESQRIGIINIPHAFWKTMRTKPVYFIDIPFEARLDFIESAYGKLEKEKLVNAIIRIQKRLGPLETKSTIGFLLEDNYREAFRILLAYYDKTYSKALHTRENIELLLNKIPLLAVDTIYNTEKLVSCATENT